MALDPLGPDSLDPFLEAIPRILRSSSFDDSLIQALELLRGGVGAAAAAVYLADGDAPLRELWAPRDPATKSSLRPLVKVEALEAIRRGGSHLTAWDRAEPDGARTRTLLLASDSGPFGALVLVWRSPGPAAHSLSERWVHAVVEMIAWSAIQRGEVSRLRVQAERDKRWFKTLDDHLRVLDRERQKFAAVVNQTDTFVFVTDESRVIRWNNRAMAVLLPPDSEGSSWIGKTCRDVCSRLGQEESGSEPCGCPIRRALEANDVTHQEIRIKLQGTPGVLYLTALPIKGVEGTPHEVMVLVQDLTGLESLRQLDVRYRVLFERNAEAILIADAATRQISLANPAARAMLGYSAQELDSLSLEALHPAGEWERLCAYYDEPSAPGGPARIECGVLTSGGERRDALVSATRVELGERDVHLIELVDVTERRRVEEALGESEARKGAMVEAALDAIISMDHAGRIIEFNPAAERIFGYCREEALGRDMAQLIIPPALRELHRVGMERHLATGERRMLGRRTEITAMRSDGSEFPAEVTVARISSRGAPIFTGFIRDITERKQVEEALRAAKDRLRTVIATAPLVLFSIDRNGIFTLSEGRGLERLGRQEGEAVGKSVYDLYRDYPELLANVARGLAGEEFTSRVDVGALSYETHYMPVRDAAGEVVSLIGVATDVTERRELEAQLRHAQKMEAIGRLAGGVAHDFNNLLTVIQGHSEMMLGSMSPQDPHRKSAEEIQRAGSRGALLTRQLLAFSRRDLAAPEVLDVAEVVRRMESMLHRMIGEDVQLTANLPAEGLGVRADRGQLEQVIANLAVNARDAMPHGGELRIEAGAMRVDPEAERRLFDVPPGDYVMLAVSDQGSGMTPEIVSHVFEPFFTTKEQGKGTGLGLSVVYGIVRQTGGDVRVETEPGGGTTFRILLPRCAVTGPQAAAAAADDPGPAAAVSRGRGTILLAEDENAVRVLAREMLELLGYEVLVASNGEEALRLFEENERSIRAAVTDVVMPGMSGVDLAVRLVKRRPNLRVLLVSGYTRDSLADDVFVREGFAFLQKPYTLEDMRRKLGEMLQGSSVGDREPAG